LRLVGDARPYTDMALATDIRDVSFCLRKAVEYRAKAKKTSQLNLKSAFEAATREYDSRAQKNTVRISKSNAVLHFRTVEVSKALRIYPK
jgi:hypothetical protein